MRHPKLWAGVAAVAVAVAACERKPEPAPAPKPAAPAAPVAAAPTGTPGPLTFNQKTADAEVSLSLPPAVAAVPSLYAKLYAEGRNGLQAFADGAKGDLEEQRANGDKVQPYRQSLAYSLSAETPKLIGLQLVTAEESGGAHPNNSLKGLIWDKAAGKEVKAGDLFAAGADMSAAEKALCDGVRAARKARQPAAAPGDCPKLKSASLTLAPSTTPGKAGGVLALFSGFALGGGADYRIAIPFDAIHTELAPAYAAEFAGAPAPVAG